MQKFDNSDLHELVREPLALELESPACFGIVFKFRF